MIIFYNKKTGDMYASIDGRVHDDNTLKNRIIKPNNLALQDVGRYIVSYKKLTRKVKRSIYKNLLNPKTFEIKQVKVGEEDAIEGAGMEINDQFKDFFSRVESGETNLFTHRFIIKEGKIVGIEPKPVDIKQKMAKPNQNPEKKINQVILSMRNEINDLKIQIREMKTKQNTTAPSGIIE